MRALFEYLPLPHEGVTHVLGLPTEMDEPLVVDDAVYDGGHLVVAEHRSPPAELQVRGDHHRLPLVGVDEDLEEEPRAVPHRAAGCAMRPIEVVDERRLGRYPADHGLPHARRAWLPVAACDGDGVLVDVDGDADAQLLAGQPVALGEVGTVDVGLVDPDGVAQLDPVLVAGLRSEHAVPPLEGGLVDDAAQLDTFAISLYKLIQFDIIRYK